MENIYKLFENLDEVVYVSDMDTYEIVYMNKLGLKNYGLTSLDDAVGKKCYSLLQGHSKPCAMCTNCKLREGEFVEWRYFNPVFCQKLELKDTMLVVDGRRLRLEIAFNVTQQERQDEILRQYKNLETLSNEAFRLALQAESPDTSIEIILEYLGKALKPERTYIFEKNAEGGDDNTYEWAAEGVTSEKDNLQNLPESVCANWYKEFNSKGVVIIKDLEETKESDPLMYDVLKAQNIKSLVVVPLLYRGKPIGFYGVDNPPAQSLDYSKDMLQIVAHFIVFSIKRRNMVKQLIDISYHDRLTGFGNRYALDKYLSTKSFERGLGIVYCDITGLKTVNDSFGHEAGDRLILSACLCLKQVFGDYALFRVGGDEIVAMCEGITCEQLYNSVQKLRGVAAESEVVLAVGTDWDIGKSLQFDKLLKVAEQKMYEDKAEYYRVTGLDRRK